MLRLMLFCHFLVGPLSRYDPDNGGVGNMPQVNKLLVDKGTMFMTYLVTTPLCAPARASLFTGRFPHNHHVLSDTDTAG